MIRLIAASLLVCLAPAVSATPITWTLNNVTFFDGAEAIGAFDFDADTGLFSNVSIQTSPGVLATPGLGSGTDKPFDGARYDAAISSIQSPGNIVAYIESDLPDLTGSSVLFLDFAQALPGGGGILNVVRGSEYECRVALCDSFDPTLSDFRPINSGSVTARVPVPGTLGMIAVGLLGALGARRLSSFFARC